MMNNDNNSVEEKIRAQTEKDNARFLLHQEFLKNEPNLELLRRLSRIALGGS